jgi:hypothetical protein
MALCIANGDASTNLGLKILRVQEKGGRTNPRSGPGQPAWADEGLIRETKEGGSEWEPIKILLGGDGNSNKMNTASNTRL